MKHLLYITLQFISVLALGQTIEVPSNVPLTIQGNLNLNTGFSIQYGGQTYINAPADGSANTYLGFGAGNTKTGQQNTFIGNQAGFSNTTGAQNVFVGASSGIANTTGNNNAFIGYQTGQTNTSGSGNAFIGYQAGNKNTTGTSNAFIGYTAGLNNTTGNNNSFIGYFAGQNNSIGVSNAFIGTYAGYSNTSGNENSFIGTSAGTLNTTGTGNAFIGTSAGYANTTGIGNAYIGIRAGQNATTANGNTFVGGAAGNATTTGGQNTYLGQNAGYIGNVSGSNNVFIGAGSGVDAAGRVVNNSVAIGANALVTTSNAVVLGNGANVGIGNSAPLAKLHLTTGVANTSGLRLENLTSGSPASVVNQTKFLSVNASGDVILASSNSSARLGGELWTAFGEYVQSTAVGGVLIGENINRTPRGYKLYVQDGILTEKVKVAIKTTDEWSDKVFDSGYKLKGLAEVERYININKHLPGVPSAKEVVEKGIDVAKMDAKLLEKIEELTLYSIKLEKQVEKANQQLQANDKRQQTEIDELKQLVKRLARKR